MQHVRSHGFGTLTPTDALADVVQVLRAARDWSCEVDESLRKAGCQPDGGVLGMPLAQVDVIIIILDRTHDAMQEALVALATAERTLAAARRAQRIGKVCAGVCLALALVNLGFVIGKWF